MTSLASQAARVIGQGSEVSELQLQSSGATIACRLHLAGGDAAVLWVFGSGGGLGGPAGGVYTRLATQLRPLGVSGLELDYRRPGQLEPCVQDVLTGLAFLAELGKTRAALVGHSFGGAVVISAAAESRAVVAVAALSSQTAGTDAVSQIAPRPLLLVHGTADEILPERCSRDLYARAKEPKRLVLYPDCRHGLDQCREALDAELFGWLREVLGVAA